MNTKTKTQTIILVFSLIAVLLIDIFMSYNIYHDPLMLKNKMMSGMNLAVFGNMILLASIICFSLISKSNIKEKNVVIGLFSPVFYFWIVVVGFYSILPLENKMDFINVIWLSFGLSIIVGVANYLLNKMLKD